MDNLFARLYLKSMFKHYWNKNLIFKTLRSMILLGYYL